LTRNTARPLTTAGARCKTAAEQDACAPGTEVRTEQVRSILASNDSPDVGFDLSINPYRGCEHVIFYEHVCD
jgi:hypothetical protein